MTTGHSSPPVSPHPPARLTKPKRHVHSTAPPVPPRPPNLPVNDSSDSFYRRFNAADNISGGHSAAMMAQSYDVYAPTDIQRFATPGPSRYFNSNLSPPVGYNNNGYAAPGAQHYNSQNTIPAPIPWLAPQPTRHMTVDVGSLASSVRYATLREPTQNAKTGHGFINYPTPAPSRQSSHSSMPRAASVPPQAQKPAQENFTAPLPTVASLQAALKAVQRPDASPESQIAWIRDVLLLVNRDHAKNCDANDSPLPFAPDEFVQGHARITDPALARLTDGAIPLLISLAPSIPDENEQSESRPPSLVMSPAMAEALHLRAALTAAGTFPSHLPASPREAFAAFTAAARAGHTRSWRRLASDYESFGDNTHALSCVERGASLGDPSCLHRLGIARLLGQLGLERDVERGLSAMRAGADAACVGCAEPAYAYALVLLRSSGIGGEDEAEFVVSNIPRVSRQELAQFIPVGKTPARVGASYLARAAFLHCVPAQRRLAHAHECGGAPWAYDPSLSVRWYARAGANGDARSDAALGRWFLAGAPGAFGPDEAKARIFAEKAARRNLKEAQFAMGYVCEVGVGGPRDLEEAKRWYEKAAAQGSEEAFERLTALMQPVAQPFERVHHEEFAVRGIERRRTLLQKRAQEAAYAAGEEQSEYTSVLASTPEQNMGGSSWAPQQQQQQLTPPRSFTPLPPRDNQYYQNQKPWSIQQNGPSLSQSQPSLSSPYDPKPLYRSATPSANSVPQKSYPVRQASLPTEINTPIPTSMPVPHHQHSLPSQNQIPISDYTSFNVSSHLEQQALQFSGRPRFTLVDDGPAPGASMTMRSRRTASQASNGSAPSIYRQRGYSRERGRQSQENRPGTAPEMEDEPKQSTKYETFADMGITARKAEDKDCVIM